MKLAIRIVLLITFVTLSMGFLTIIFSTPVIKKGFQKIDYEWTKTLSESLSEGIANDTINGNATRVRQIIDTVVLKNKELEYAYVVDFDEQLFTHTFKEGFPIKLLDIAKDTESYDHLHQEKNSNVEYLSKRFRTILLDGKKIDDISYPIIEGMSARLHLGLGDESDKLLLKDIEQKLFLIIFMLGLVGIAIAFPLSRQLTKPLEQLGNLIQDYGSNKVKGQFEIPKGSVEIITLGETFNQMIKDRALADKELKQFKDTLDQTLDCVFMFDADKLNFFYVNEGALQQIGYSFDELQSMHPYDIKPEVSGPQFYELIAPLISGEKESLNFETVHQHKNGKKICVEIFLQYIAPENQSARFVAIVRDVTDRKKAEEEIKELNISLESRVKERTKELESTLLLLTDENEQRKKAESQFREAKEQAEKASAAKSDFLSRMSHELRTPMNAILGFGQLLELDSKEFNESQKENIQEILEAGNHLLELINDVLDLTEIEAGKLEISMGKVELNDVVPQCISLMEPIAKTRQIKQIDNLSEKGYILHADFTRLKQVFLNLLSNAVKYNIEGGTIILAGEVVDKKYLRISITDTGEGIKEEDISKLFTSFERLNPKVNVEGSGIGLNITKHIVELMGGKVGVMSTPDQGSTFWFELKLSKDLYK